MSQILPDFGPRYTETNFDQFPVEPLNTFSNLLFLFVCLYWFLKLKHISNSSFKTYLKRALPLLLIGYLGGTLYHATRAHWLWMLMDVLPIYLIGWLTALYLWGLVNVSKKLIFMAFLVLFLLPNIILWTFYSEFSHKITFGYISLVVPCLLPILIDLYNTRWKFVVSVFIPLILISIALTMRVLDDHPWIQNNYPWGTHWLWHMGGALTSHFLLLFMEKRSHY